MLEDDLVLAVVCLARSTTNTEITRGEQDGDTTSAELSKGVANTDSVVERNGLFIISVGGGDGLRDGDLVGEEVEPVEVGLVGVSLKDASVRTVWREG